VDSSSAGGAGRGYPVEVERIPLNPTVESAEQVTGDLVTAAKYIPRERLGATDDCGFSPFSIDQKPKHGSPDFARDVAFEKMTARVQGVQRASEGLGLLRPAAELS